MQLLLEKRVAGLKKNVDTGDMARKKAGESGYSAFQIDSDVRDTLDDLAARYGVSMKKMVADLIRWADRQHDAVVRDALGHLPSGYEIDVLRLVLQRREEAKRLAERQAEDRPLVITETPPGPSSRQSPEPQGPTDDRLSPRPSTLPGSPPRPGAGKRK
jgi:hypothetical protein